MLLHQSGGEAEKMTYHMEIYKDIKLLLKLLKKA